MACKAYGGTLVSIAHCVLSIANKVLVPTLSALRNFSIIARHKGLGGGFGFVLPVRARTGRTTQALASFSIVPIPLNEF